jgi:hypothetical protein
MLQQLKIKWTGVSPLILHNGQTSDPLNPFAKAMKEVSAKRKKTDDDYRRMAEIEYRAGLYYSDDHGVVMPADCIASCLVGGAKISKLGRQFTSSVFIVEPEVPIKYSGPKDPEELFADKRFVLTKAVRVQNAKVMRTRPIFREWSLSFTLEFDPEVLNKREIVEASEGAGHRVGLCDWRPRYGRFNSEVLS